MKRAALAAVLAPAALAACALLSPAKEMTTARLEKTPAEVPRAEAGPATLLLFRPDAKPAFDTARMAYSVRPYEVAYYKNHQWGGTPGQMLLPLLAKTLESTGRFKAVLSPPYTGRYTYGLRTEILELVQDYTSEPPVLRLSLRLRLSDDTANRLVAAREITLAEPMRGKTPYAGVLAANEAGAKALAEAARFVLDNAG